MHRFMVAQVDWMLHAADWLEAQRAFGTRQGTHAWHQLLFVLSSAQLGSSRPTVTAKCRFVVLQCNHLLRSEEWLEARAALGMPPLPAWEHGEDQCLLSHDMATWWCLHAPESKCVSSLLDPTPACCRQPMCNESDCLPHAAAEYYTQILLQ